MFKNVLEKKPDELKITSLESYNWSKFKTYPKGKSQPLLKLGLSKTSLSLKNMLSVWARHSSCQMDLIKFTFGNPNFNYLEHVGYKSNMKAKYEL